MPVRNLTRMERRQMLKSALREAGAIVPDSFDDYGDKIKETYEELLKEGIIKRFLEIPIPVVLVHDEAVKRFR